MTTAAYSAFGLQVRLGDGTPLAPLTISDATNATPIVITTSTAHGVTDVSYGTVVGVNGNTAANGSWVVERVDATRLKLRTSVGNAAYTSGGTLTLLSTFASIAELRDAPEAGSRTDLIDVTAHDATAGYSSQLPTLKRTNTLRLDINLNPELPTHDEVTGLLGLYNSGVRRHWLFVLPAYPATGVKSTGHFYAAVDYYTMNLPVNGALQAQVTLVSDGAFDWAGN